MKIAIIFIGTNKYLDFLPKYYESIKENFLPNSEKELVSFSKNTGIDIEKARTQSLRLREANPMLGHRGCRLAISYPEICEMQARAIIEAAVNVQRKIEEELKVEIMIPLASTSAEIDFCKDIINSVAASIIKKSKINFNYLVGKMIELPRAALCAEETASSADFFSFGTNDLTQTTLGISRDDIGSFLNRYIDAGIFPHDPFVSIDKKGVGSLVKLALINREPLSSI